MSEEFVRHMPLLKRMAKEGIIKLHVDTGRKVGGLFGGKHTAYYVSDRLDGLITNTPFHFEGERYCLKYVDGCFCPFVVRIT